ncbi:uncharacterized protein ELE39_003531 [Cryptosporidium sp. chipmunk genotype I]|uniref:uncharacterized protein n=1 Tax=Cryptosporidium sp. chipmunk genotype I TaxID=1280935 RepID=UPI00351A48B7|nr:hypothetical protein ELE39_003531 [Cryptosporidium sp. chipmunk genotype I]
MKRFRRRLCCFCCSSASCDFENECNSSSNLPPERSQSVQFYNSESLGLEEIPPPPPYPAPQIPIKPSLTFPSLPSQGELNLRLSSSVDLPPSPPTLPPPPPPVAPKPDKSLVRKILNK